MSEMERKKWILVRDDYDPICYGTDVKTEALEEMCRMQLEGQIVLLFERQDILILDTLKEQVKEKIWQEEVNSLPVRVKNLQEGIVRSQQEIEHLQRHLVEIANGTYYALQHPVGPFDIMRKTAEDYRRETIEEIERCRTSIVEGKKLLATVQRALDSKDNPLEWNGTKWVIKKELEKGST